MTTTTGKPIIEETLVVGTMPATHGSDDHSLELTLRIEDKGEGPVVSIVGNVWRKDRRDITQGGQIHDSLLSLYRRCDVRNVSEYQIGRIAILWKRWHRNDMRAGCEHQRARWHNVTRKVEVVHYHLTLEAYQMRQAALSALTEAAIRGPQAVAELVLTPTARALVEMEDWFEPRFAPPDADSPLSGCFEVEKREEKGIGWTYPSEHPQGILGKPCEVCGYKYGHEWRFEPVPADVLAELSKLFTQPRSSM